MVVQNFPISIKNSIICIIFWQLLLITILFSQSINPQFDQITTEHGLSNNRVNAILKDSKGFMWFGTNDGLNKYDGYNLTVYRHNPEDPHSLCDNTIL